jgi:PPOX class probable F420-dependent enzyme
VSRGPDLLRDVTTRDTGDVLSDDQIAYLEAHRVARLATVSGAGQPHALPVCYAVVDGVVYTPLDRKPKRVSVARLRRVRDLRENPAVCLVVDDYDDDWAGLRWLQVRGEAAVVEPGPEHGRAISALRRRYRQYRAMPLEELPVIRITPQQVVEWSWSDQTADVEERGAHL